MSQIFGFIEQVFWFLVILESVVISHFLGRFLFAWLAGLRLRKFTIGLGSTPLFKRSISDGVIELTRFPLGGTLRFHGEHFGGEERSGPPARFFQRLLALLGGPCFQILTAMLLLWGSFSWYGDTSFTMQVVNTKEGSPAQMAGLERGDVILEVAGAPVKRFETGQRMIEKHPNQEISFLIERRTGYKTFHELQELMEYLDKSYQDRNYIRIHTKDEELPALFYARDPALELLQKVDLRDLKVEISTARQEFEIKVTPDDRGKVGIGIKPYSLADKTVYPSVGKAFTLAFGYTYILCREFLFEVWNMIVNFFQLGNIPLEMNVILELFRFISDFSTLGMNELMKLISMLCIAVGLLNLFPLPRSVGFHAFSLCLRFGVNSFCRSLLGKKGDVIDDEYENYIKWLYGAAFGLLFILLIFHSFPAISGP